MVDFPRSERFQFPIGDFPTRITQNNSYSPNTENNDNNEMDIWNLDRILCGRSHLHMTAPLVDKQAAIVPNDWTGNALKMQAVSDWIKGGITFILLLLVNGKTMDVNLYDIHILLHSKESVCCVRKMSKK